MDYTLNIAGQGDYVPVVTGVGITSVKSGCGSDNSKCSCAAQVVPVPGVLQVHLSGYGTDSTWTGLIFTCRFTVNFVSPTLGVGPQCTCALAPRHPVWDDDRSFDRSCSCVSGFSYAMPTGGHDFTASDTVTMIAWP